MGLDMAICRITAPRPLPKFIALPGSQDVQDVGVAGSNPVGRAITSGSVPDTSVTIYTEDMVALRYSSLDGKRLAALVEGLVLALRHKGPSCGPHHMDRLLQRAAHLRPQISASGG